MAEEAELAGSTGSNADNLGNAIKDGSDKVETTYREFTQLIDAD